MDLVMGGLSHKTAPVEIREGLEIPKRKLEGALALLLQGDCLHEGVIISTCNRTEVYVVAHSFEEGKEGILKYLTSYHKLSQEELLKYLYFFANKEAASHLFEVSSSLDSMVVGEAQVLGQVKEAYAAALETKATSIILNRLFNQAIATGKKARTQTSIGESAVSVSYAAVELAKRIFENLRGKVAMILGAGEMSELTLKHLVSAGVSTVLVSNRTFHRAVELAKRFQGKAINFDQLVEYMAEADIVISSTAAPHYILKKEDLSKVMSKRKGRPIFLIDIAVPRDIDPKVNKLENVFLYDIDDLEGVVQANIAEREKESRKVRRIIGQEVEGFSAWIHSLEVTPTIAALKKKAEEIRVLETERILRKLDHLSPRERNIVNALTGTIVNKLLHQPIVKVKDGAPKKDGYIYLEALRKLFELEELDGVGLKKKLKTKK